jgi:hypothetical protein
MQTEVEDRAQTAQVLMREDQYQRQQQCMNYQR